MNKFPKTSSLNVTKEGIITMSKSDALSILDWKYGCVSPTLTLAEIEDMLIPVFTPLADIRVQS